MPIGCGDTIRTNVRNYFFLRRWERQNCPYNCPPNAAMVSIMM